MATRTSQSSPCFLRVAEASAASSASKMISLSTPFSFETASTTIRISLLITAAPSRSSPLRRKPRTSNFRESHRYHGAIHLQFNALRVQGFEPPSVAAPSVAGDPQFQPDAFADEPLKMRWCTQYPVQSRRGHLQCVRARHRVLDI